MIGSSKNTFLLAKAIAEDTRRTLAPPEDGLFAEAQMVIPMSILKGTHGYLERVGNQINGCYSSGWYDACAVMIRRLIETLIIESFEKHGLAAKIKNTKDDFFFLKDLISACLAERTWNLSRNCKQALPRLKDVGDKSAHSRRYIGQRGDLEPLLADIRLVVQELVFLAELK